MTLDAALLAQVAAGVRLSDLTPEQLLDHVADQVASSQRLAGIEVTPEQVKGYLVAHLDRVRRGEVS